MAYSIVLGDLGPVMPLTLTDDGTAFTLDAVNDTVTLHYSDPSGVVRQIAVTIVDAPNGACQVAWVDGDLPLVGIYTGQVRVTRAGNTTFPRSFPNDGSFIYWTVQQQIA